MVDTRPPSAVQRRRGRSPARPRVVPPVWSRITNLDGRPRRGLVADHDRTASATSTTPRGSASRTPATPIRGSSRRSRPRPQKLLHGQQNIVYHEPGLRLYERLQHVLPGDGWGAFLSNSGAEAVEAAVKLARVATGRPVDHRRSATATTAGRPRRWR